MRSLLLGVGLACLVGAAHAGQGYSPAAQRVLAQARAATGGAAWNRLRGWHEVGRQGGMRYEVWLDPVRYGLRVETHEPAGLRVHGFNGAGDWQIQPSGGVSGLDVTSAVSEARTEAFFETRGYFYPGRFDARGDYIGVRQHRGRAFDVVSVKPWGGEARELWFDRQTHLLRRLVAPGPSSLAIEISDYRPVGPLRLPFRYTLEGGGPNAPARQVESVTFPLVDRALFSLPRPSQTKGRR